MGQGPCERRGPARRRLVGADGAASRVAHCLGLRRHRQLGGTLEAQVPLNGLRLCDLGCGPGFFTATMAELVGPSGRVIAVDLQEEMLAKVRSKLVNPKRQSMPPITLHQCSEHEIGLDESIKADFILACYMVHETPDQYRFFQQVKILLKTTSTFLVIEPPFHVSNKDFAKMLGGAEQAGLTVIDRPRGKGGRSALLAIKA